MTKTPVNLQDSFLNQVRKDGVPVTIYLVNGFQIKGMIRGFDNFTVVLESDGKQMLVYKHALSTITVDTTRRIFRLDYDAVAPIGAPAVSVSLAPPVRKAHTDSDE